MKVSHRSLYTTPFQNIELLDFENTKDYKGKWSYILEWGSIYFLFVSLFTGHLGMLKKVMASLFCRMQVYCIRITPSWFYINLSLSPFTPSTLRVDYVASKLLFSCHGSYLSTCTYFEEKKKRSVFMPYLYKLKLHSLNWFPCHDFFPFTSYSCKYALIIRL